MAAVGGIVYSKKKSSQQEKQPRLEKEKIVTERIISEKEQFKLERIETQRELTEKLTATDNLIQQKEFRIAKEDLNTFNSEASSFNLKGLIKQARSKLEIVNHLEIQDAEIKVIKNIILELIY